MIRALLAAAALLAGSPALAAPSAEEAAVVAAAQRLFDAMAAQDATAIRDLVLPGTVFTSVQPADGGGTRVTRLPLDDFAKNLRPGLDERMWTPRVSVRGGLIATVSAPYEFKLEGKTTHCGIDVFSLAKVDGVWKISGLTWTREPNACAELKARK